MYTNKDNLIAEMTMLIQHVATVKEQHEEICDIHYKLCRFLSKMLSGPLTGRIYIQNPENYVTEDEKEASLRQYFAHS